METLIIYGCGGHARSVAASVMTDWNIIFIDSAAKKNEKIFGFDVLTSLDGIHGIENCYFHIAVGDCSIRKNKFEEWKKCGFRFPVLLSKTAIICPEAVIGCGTFIAEGGYVGPYAVIGENAIVNTHAVIEHDSSVQAHSHISINSTVAGYTHIGSSVFLGAGATVIDRLKICNSVIVGAGAVVCNDIVTPGTYVGIPAKKIHE